MTPSIELFAGKGGVGKTTCAAGRAVAAARRGGRVLVVSTDPAHSLGDAFDTTLSPRVRSIAAGRGGAALQAVQFDAPRAFARWLQAHRQALGDAIEHGTWLDRADVDALLELPVPGLDELLGIIEIAQLASSGDHDLIVVDTAPTGHTLRLLAAPQTVAAVSDALDQLQAQHRAVRRQLARVARPEAADRLIELLASQAGDAAALLRNRGRTAFRLVMLPEPLALAETDDALAALARAGVTVRDVIVNRVVGDGPPCPVCDVRRDMERRVIAELRAQSGRRISIRTIAEQGREPRGAARLAAIGDALESRPLAVTRARAVGRRPPALRTSGMGIATRPLHAALGGARLIFVSGKGGVGKTTIAAAIALAAARRSRSVRVLVLSTDPAHSLGDVFAQPVAADPAAVAGGPPNLHAREVDAARVFASTRAALEAVLEEAVAAFGLPAGSEGVSELMELAPPGIDELFGVLSVVEARDAYDTIVVDTAPTGHALRLLEMPEAARVWLQTLLRVLLKYKELLRPGQLAARLVELSKSVRDLQRLLTDGDQTRFVVVTRAAAVPTAETLRLLGALRRLHLHAAAVVVNARTLRPGACPRCRRVDRAERVQLPAVEAACRRRGSECAIIQTPLAAPPPRGFDALEAWAQTWM